MLLGVGRGFTASSQHRISFVHLPGFPQLFYKVLRKPAAKTGWLQITMWVGEFGFSLSCPEGIICPETIPTELFPTLLPGCGDASCFLKNCGSILLELCNIMTIHVPTL